MKSDYNNHDLNIVYIHHSHFSHCYLTYYFVFWYGPIFVIALGQLCKHFLKLSSVDSHTECCWAGCLQFSSCKLSMSKTYCQSVVKFRISTFRYHDLLLIRVSSRVKIIRKSQQTRLTIACCPLEQSRLAPYLWQLIQRKAIRRSIDALLFTRLISMQRH